MNVLLANSTCKVGGVSTFMLSLREALLSLGHRCELFFFNRGTMERHLPADCPVHFGTLADCMRLVARERFDVVHANNIDWTTGISAVRQAGAKLVLTAHKVRDDDRCYGWTGANSDALTAVSEWVRRDLQPYTDSPIQVVRNGVDLDAFHPDGRPQQGPPIVAWVGRGASPLKRLDVFAGIGPALHRAGIRIRVLDQHGVEQAARVLPEAVATLQPLAEWWGAVPFARMPEFYREVAASGGCVVSTSSREGLGLSLLEAQACGCPVVGPDVPGVSESVSPQHGGVLYRSGMPAGELAALVIETVRDTGALESRRQAAVEFVRRHFGRGEMARQYVRIYEEAPLPGEGSVLSRARRRLRHSPLFHWRAYVDQRWSVGREQYEASQEFAAEGERRLSAAAAWEAFRTSPTIYIKPRRLAHLVRAQLLARGAGGGTQPAAAGTLGPRA